MNKHNGVNKKKAFRKSWSRDQVSLNTKTMRFGKNYYDRDKTSS